MRKLKEIGVREDEILFQPVTYRDLRNTDYFSEPSPVELFNKDVSYSEQHEIRCVVCSNRPEIQKHFEERKGVIELGEMKDAAFAMDYFFKDMALQARDKHLLFELSKPVEIPLNDVDELIAVIGITLSGKNPAAQTIPKMEELIAGVAERLDKEFGAHYDPETVTVRKADGSVETLGGAAYQLLYDFQTLYSEEDEDAMADYIAKFRHFFPGYRTNAFDAYYASKGEENPFAISEEDKEKSPLSDEGED